MVQILPASFPCLPLRGLPRALDGQKPIFCLDLWLLVMAFFICFWYTFDIRWKNLSEECNDESKRYWCVSFRALYGIPSGQERCWGWSLREGKRSWLAPAHARRHKQNQRNTGFHPGRGYPQQSEVYRALLKIEISKAWTWRSGPGPWKGKAPEFTCPFGWEGRGKVCV